MKKKLTITYGAVWLGAAALFWLFPKSVDPLAFGLIVMWVLLPILTLALSICWGKDECSGRGKWLLPLVLGLMNMLMEYATFSAANMVAFGKINMPEFEMLFAGAAISMVGLLIGQRLRKGGKV